jgi:hypothetical protein
MPVDDLQEVLHPLQQALQTSLLLKNRGTAGSARRSGVFLVPSCQARHEAIDHVSRLGCGRGLQSYSVLGIGGVVSGVAIGAFARGGENVESTGLPR